MCAVARRVFREAQYDKPAPFRRVLLVDSPALRSLRACVDKTLQGISYETSKRSRAAAGEHV
jgi:hypothetical protein